MTPLRSIYLLTGGKSSRMGQDKASLPYDDDTLLEYQAERCRSLFHEVVLLSGQKTYPVPDRHVFDEEADAGPLSGILSGLKDPGDQESVAVMAVDLPMTTLETLRLLATRDMPGGTDVLIADASLSWSGTTVPGKTESGKGHGSMRTDQSRVETHKEAGEGVSRSLSISSIAKEWRKSIQPLLGIYHRRIVPQLTDYLREGNRSVMGFLDRVSVSGFPVREEEIRNINTREEYRKFISRKQ